MFFIIKPTKNTLKRTYFISLLPATIAYWITPSIITQIKLYSICNRNTILFLLKKTNLYQQINHKINTKITKKQNNLRITSFIHVISDIVRTTALYINFSCSLYWDGELNWLHS